MNKMRSHIKGVTLIEVLLVTVIISAILYMTMGYIEQKTTQTRIEKAVAQLQQITNAAQLYYATNGSWPSSLECLQGLSGCPITYLYSPMVNAMAPGQGIVFDHPYGDMSYLRIWSPVLPSSKSYALTNAIIGMLPLATTMNEYGNEGGCTEASAGCSVVVRVNKPAQEMSNATAVNFAALYHNGACVPVPTCPLAADGTQMQASIVVVPASVTGAYDAPTGGGCNPENLSACTVSAYPINSFGATATGPSTSADDGPPGCASGVNEPCYESVDSSGNPQDALPAGSYWRVCLSVVTEKGAVNPTGGSATGQAWGQLSGYVMAITKCTIPSDDTGSGFTVWSQ